MLCIHYGSKKFRPERWHDISDAKRYSTKPGGGLWSSPVDSKYGWREWCHAESFAKCDKRNSFTFEVSGRILTIDASQDTAKMPWKELVKGFWVPLFEPLITQGYCAVHLTGKGQEETRYGNQYSLYGWDCESVLVLQRDAIHLGQPQG